ncbi:MAG: dTMP kinase [Betaproteobacteria bacterium]|jgi:dTMP kinase|nr:dTMP kinase [Betaproteobacteria bacterium]
MRGKFITLEGLDGAGKTTQLGWLTRFLQQRGIALRVTREPGGTSLGEKLRVVLLDPAQKLNPETETLLMFAARREHLDKLIIPALEEGTWVLCDRFTDATFAYQAGGSGVDWSKVEALESWVHGSLQPDLTVYFDVSPEIGRARTAAIKAPDRFEQERDSFYARVRAAYLRRAHESHGRIRVIDASSSIEVVQAELEPTILSLIECSAVSRGIPADSP